MSQIIINEEVREALESCRGVVALETAVMTHGASCRATLRHRGGAVLGVAGN